MNHNKRTERVRIVKRAQSLSSMVWVFKIMGKHTHNGRGGGNGTTIEILQQDNCRVAYTLNNEQPVRCSIIGDQPLFYMDFEGDLEDEMEFSASGFFDAADLGPDPFGIDAIEAGVQSLKERVLAAEASLSEPGLPQLRMEEFMDEMRAALDPELAASADSEFDLRSLRAALEKSRLAHAYLALGEQYGLGLHFSEQIDTAHYDRDANAIYLNPRRDRTDQILLLARELRRVWQHRSGALLHPLTFHPDQAILVNRAQIADLAASTVRVAWELQLAGAREAWERLEESSMADLARAFAREAYLDFRTINNGSASAAVFESWFLSDRCRTEDRALIQQMLADYQGYVFDGEDTSRTITTDLVLALGTMPFGKNYLASFMPTILSDAIFTEVRDRSNANFLWFIKFERSFRDAEQELQTSEPIHTGASATGITKTKLDGDKHEKTAANIIRLPGADHASATGKNIPAKRAVGSGGADIVYLQPVPSDEAGGA